MDAINLTDDDVFAAFDAVYTRPEVYTGNDAKDTAQLAAHWGLSTAHARHKLKALAAEGRVREVLLPAEGNRTKAGWVVVKEGE